MEFIWILSLKSSETQSDDLLSLYGKPGVHILYMFSMDLKKKKPHYWIMNLWCLYIQVWIFHVSSFPDINFDLR